MPASSSASRPTSSTAGACSRSPNVTPTPEPATTRPRNAASSAECTRTRWSTSLVPSTVRANRDQAKASSTVRRPPGSTPTPPLSRAAARPAAAISRASTQDAGRSSPFSRTSGVVMRSGAVCHVKAKRSLSVIHSSLTTGSSPESRRSTWPRRWSMRIAEPHESCSAMLSLLTRSNGRDRNR